MDEKLVVGGISSSSSFGTELTKKYVKDDGDRPSSPSKKGIVASVGTNTRRKEIANWAAVPFPKLWAWNGILMVPSLLLFHKEFTKAGDKISLGVEGQAAQLHDLAMEKAMEHDYDEKEVAETIIRGYGDLFVNFGVVGALMVSIVFPIALQPMDLADSSIDYFGFETTKALFNTFYACTILSLVIGLSIIFESITFYKHLSFWMVDTVSKLRYTKEVNLLFLVAKGTLLVYSICIALAFGSAALVSPEAGLITLFGLIVMIILCNSTMIAEQQAYKVVHETAGRLSGIKGED